MAADVRELIARIRDGDDDAFTELCSDYKSLIASSASFYAKRGAEYGALEDDFRQEASMALYRAALSYDLTQDGVTFGLYAKRCIRNALVSQLRRHGARARSVARQAERAADSAEQAVITEEMRRLYMRRIEGLLSPFEGEVLMLSMEGRRPRHIARSLNTSAKAVSNALFRARTKLREDPELR